MRHPLPATLCLSVLLNACGGDGSGDNATPPFASVSDSGAQEVGDGPFVVADPSVDQSADLPSTSPARVPDAAAIATPGEIQGDPDGGELDPLSPGARYRVTLENGWGAEHYPQDFPDDAHLSLIGGALHGENVVFWARGQPVSRGMEDLAETGRIDILLYDEVVPAIEAGDASALIEYRRYTGPMIDDTPGTSTFDILADAAWPRLTLATMLGPSPDWFVGVSGLALDDENGWRRRIEVDLPLLDGGSKSDIVPVMGGPDIIPPDPVGYVAYDPATGTYLPSMEPAVVARLIVERVE